MAGMSEDRCISLYGNAAGDWALVESPPGCEHPGTIGGLRYLCDSGEALALILSRIPRAGRYPAQQMIADLTGVKQQTVSRYLLTGQSRLELPGDGWRRVSALLYACTEWHDKPYDQQAVREFLRTGEAVKAHAG